MIPTSVFHSIGCCVAITLSSCNSIEQKKEQPLQKLEISINNLEDSQKKLGRTIAFLDSNLKYGRMAKEVEIKMYQAESDYYRTADEKYYRKYYRLQKEQWRLVGLANKYHDSLTGKP